MFTCPAPDSPGLYRYQVIHFGASFNHFSEDWHVWLDKLEALLRTLCWFEAHAHVDAGLGYGAHAYRWRARVGTLDAMRRGERLPDEPWDFEGGPRRFSLP